METALYSPAKIIDMGKVCHTFNLVADKPFYRGKPCAWGLRTGISIRSMSKHTDYPNPLPNEPISEDKEIIGIHIPLLASFSYNLERKTKMSALFGVELGSYIQCRRYTDYGDGPRPMAFHWRTADLDAIPVSFVLAHSFRWNFNQTWGLYAEPYLSFNLNSGFYEYKNSLWMGLQIGVMFQ